MVSKRKTGFEMQQTRRSVLRMGAGGLLAVGLVACGGGGGGGSDSDAVDLRAAYDRIVEGMNREQVIAAVGRQPNTTERNSLDWSDGNGQLLNTSYGIESQTVTYVRWDKLTSPTGTLIKQFD